MTVLVQQDVLWLEIPVDNSVVVEASEGVNYFCGVNLGPLFGKSLVFAQISEHLTTV